MMKFSSKEEWKEYCFSNHKTYLKNKYFRCWLKQKKVDIFNCSRLKKEELRLIKTAIGNALRLCGKGSKISINNGINLDFAVKNGNIDGARVLSMIKKSRKGKFHAGIFLVNRQVKSGRNVLNFGDALTYVSDGVTIFTFEPDVKYPKKFFRNEVAHEIYHLLGLNIHHYDTQVQGYGKLSKCIMEYNAPSERLCSKCRDGLISFWEGVKYASS